MPVFPGALIAGRYRVDRKIATGGMGEVWAGIRLRGGGKVALKTLLPSAAKDRQLVARFRREASLLERVKSDRVTRVIEFVDDPILGLVIAMDFVAGEPLGTVLGKRRLTVEEAIDVGADVAEALCDLHRASVVHRDLKPDNVMVREVAPGRLRAVVVDFGVGRLDVPVDDTDDADTPSLTQADMAVGTLPYMAPEQLLSSSTATAAADVYALGAILYRALSGAPPFDESDDGVAARRKLGEEAPPVSLGRIDAVANTLGGIIARSLARRAEVRPTAADLLAELSLLKDRARLSVLDLDGPTELAFPSSSFGDPLTPAADTTRQGAPAFEEETTRIAPSTRIVPSAPDTDRDDVTITAPGHSPKLKLARTLPAATEPTPPAVDPLTSSAVHPSRPTVHSPMLAARGPATMTSMDVAPPPGLAADRGPSIPLRLAIVGIVVAFVLGGLVGFGLRARLDPAPQPAGIERR